MKYYPHSYQGRLWNTSSLKDCIGYILKADLNVVWLIAMVEYVLLRVQPKKTLMKLQVGLMECVMTEERPIGVIEASIGGMPLFMLKMAENLATNGKRICYVVLELDELDIKRRIEKRR